MKIETLYDPDDDLLYIDSKNVSVEIKCKTCEGHGLLLTRGDTEIRCPDCHGQKTMTKSKIVHEVKPFKIDTVETDSCYDNKNHKIETDIIYVMDLGYWGDDYTEERLSGRSLYLKREDAQEECNKRNKEQSKCQ